MSLMDKIKSMFSGGSAGSTDTHADHDHHGHDHTGHDHAGGHEHEPVAPPLAADPAGLPTSDPAPSEEAENQLD